MLSIVWTEKIIFYITGLTQLYCKVMHFKYNTSVNVRKDLIVVLPPRPKS